MNTEEMRAHLERIARDEDMSPSARVRAIETLMRLERAHPAEDDEWARIVEQFGNPDAE